MTTAELKKAGFSHRYIPKIKKVDDKLLGYGLLFEGGNYISIDLRYLENNESWTVDHVKFIGVDALALLKKDLANYDLESVVEFVKKHPSQTF